MQSLEAEMESSGSLESSTSLSISRRHVSRCRKEFLATSSPHFLFATGGDDRERNLGKISGRRSAIHPLLSQYVHTEQKQLTSNDCCEGARKPKCYRATVLPAKKMKKIETKRLDGKARRTPTGDFLKSLSLTYRSPV